MPSRASVGTSAGCFLSRAGTRVDARLERIEACCSELEAAAATPLDVWLRSTDAVAAAERRLEVAIQAAIDVAMQFIATNGWPTPDFADDAAVPRAFVAAMVRAGAADDPPRS